LKLIKAEYLKLLFTYIKNKKTTLFSLLLLVIIIGITLNIYENRFHDLDEISSIILGTIFLIRIMLSGLMFPISQLAEDINRNSLDNIMAISNYNLENQVLIRSVFSSIFNVFIALFFIFLINLIAPVSLDKNLNLYIMLLVIGIIGSFSVIGLGFIMASIVWKFNIKLPIVILSQILLTLLIFATPFESFLIPFSNTKLFVINLFDGYTPNFVFFIKHCIIVLVNSIFYLLLGYLFFKFTRINIIQNKIKGWNDQNDN